MKSFVIPLRNAKNKIYLFHLEKILNEKLVPEGSKRVKSGCSGIYINWENDFDQSRQKNNYQKREIIGHFSMTTHILNSCTNFQISKSYNLNWITLQKKYIWLYLATFQFICLFVITILVLFIFFGSYRLFLFHFNGKIIGST